MQAGGHAVATKFVRIGAIALVILGAVAFGHGDARAQLGGLDIVRQAVDAAKGKGGKKAKDLVKGKAGQKATDAIKGRGKSALEKAARDKLKDRLKDKLTRDGLKDKLKDRLTKDKLKSRLTKDGIGKDKDFRDKLGKDKGIAKDKGKGFGKDRGKDIARDKGAKDRLAKDKAGKDKLGKGKDSTAFDKTGKGKADLKSARKAIPDKRASHRIARAKNPVERGKVRVDHRRTIAVARLRLPPRPFPGTANFTGVPPATETRYVSTEMVLHVGPNVSRQTVDATAKRLGVTVIGSQTSNITGGTLYHFGVPKGRQVPTVVRAFEQERVGIASANYVYHIVQDTVTERWPQPPAGATEPQPPAEGAAEPQSAAGAPAPPGSPDQYVIEKLQLAEVHKVATGREILVAVIDSKVDTSHPDLANAIVESYDAVGRPEQAHSHGTGMAGAIVSHRKLLGIAPNARILAVHAFSTSTRQTPEATTRQIIAGIEWAINRGARIINMSFAGPYDPMIQLAMRNAAAKGVILIAASGNMGAKSPPLYPAADPHVIAVTATDETDALFPQAVRGPHVAVAAPGVEVMVPAPADTYQLTTGTSVAAAHVSGVAALLLERHPTADARTILEVLTATARNLNPKGRDDLYGWGLIDPQAALQELDSRIADGKAIATAKASPPKGTPAAKAATKAASDRASGPKTAAPKSATAPRPAAVRTAPTP